MPFIGKSPQTGEFKKLDSITTDGSSAYSLTYNSAAFEPSNAESLLVSVNGVMQEPGVGYTVNGSTITFGAALVAADVVDFVTAMGEVGNTITVSDGAINTNKLGSSLVADDTPIRVNDAVIDQNVTIASTKNAFVAGPVRLDATVTIDGTLTVI